VWSVHSLMACVGTYASTLAAMSRRSQALVAARADPSNAALVAAAQQARAETVPAGFYILCGLLSTLFDWDAGGHHSPVEVALREGLRLYRPSPAASFGSLSDNSQALTLLFPTQTQYARWGFDADVSTRHLLSITTVLQALSEKLDSNLSRGFVDPVSSFYQSTLPKICRLYIEPDVHSLATFSLNVHRSVHTAARTLLQMALGRLSPSRRKELAESVGAFYDYALPSMHLLFQPEFVLTPQQLAALGHTLGAITENGPGIGSVSEQEMTVATILCLIGLVDTKEKRRIAQGLRKASAENRPQPPTQRSGSTSSASIAPQDTLTEFEAKAQYITNTLVRVIAWPAGSEHEVTRCALSCELLQQCLPMLRRFISDPLKLLRRLYTLSLHTNDELRRAAQNTLLDGGRIAPRVFIQCMEKESSDTRSTAAAREGALMAIVALIRRHPLALARHLPATVAMVVKCLEPGDYLIRKQLLAGSTNALYALAARYPQVSFHQQSQRFAVGTAQSFLTGSSGAVPHSPVLVYDLRTATKDVFRGHQGDVHALSFHPKGMYMASYSANENPPSVRVWNTGSSSAGFLAGLLGMEGKCITSWPMLPCVRKSSYPTRSSSSTTRHMSSTSSQRSAASVEDEDFPPISGAHSDSDEDVEEPPELTGEEHNDVHSVDSSRRSSAASVSAPSAASNAASRRLSSTATPFSAEELLQVKIMWSAEKALKLKREDGSLAEFSFT
jgi:hypothetical protein